MSRAIVTLIQQSQQILDSMGPKIKQEANKKIAEVKNKIPNKESVKQMMLDEVTSKGPELVCSIEVRTRIGRIYTKLKEKSARLQYLLDKSNEKLLKLQEQLLKINTIILSIQLIIKTLRALIPVLNTVVQVARVGINFLKGPAADGASTIKLKDQIDKSTAKVQEIKNSIKVFEKKIAKIAKKALIPTGILTLAIGAINTIKTTLTAVIGLIEGFYLKYTLMCNVEGNSIQDEDYAAAIDDANAIFNNALGGINEKIIIPEGNLLPNTIEKIRNANFQVISYQIA